MSKKPKVKAGFYIYIVSKPSFCFRCIFTVFNSSAAAMESCTYCVVFPGFSSSQECVTGLMSEKPKVKAGFHIYRYFPNLPVCFPCTVPVSNSSLVPATVHSASQVTCARVIELFDRNAVNLQYLTRPKLTVFRLIFTPGCSVSWVSSLFANHVCPEWVFVCLLSPSNCVRYRIYRIFSPFFPLTFFVSCFCRESDDILHRLAS